MDYGSWTLGKLQAELRGRDARSTGRKKDLVERLEALDRMQAPDHGGPPAPSPASCPAWPDADSFRSLSLLVRPSLPELTEEDIQQYIIYR